MLRLGRVVIGQVVLSPQLEVNGGDRDEGTGLHLSENAPWVRRVSGGSTGRLVLVDVLKDQLGPFVGMLAGRSRAIR